jgi:hypothetical protein
MTTRSRRLALGTLAVALACGGGDSTAPRHVPTSIAFAYGTLTLSMGAQVPAVVLDDRRTDITTTAALAWTSSNPELVSLDAHGTITARALGGPVTITATLNDLTATATVFIVPAQVRIAPAVTELELGTTVQLSGVPVDVNGTPIDADAVLWSTANPEILRVDGATGFVEAVGEGVATISASSSGRTTRADILVGVPTQYDGTFSNTGPSPIVQIAVRFGRVRSASASATPFPGCSYSASATPNVPIVDSRFSFTFPGAPTSMNGTFEGNDVIRGSLGTILIGSLGCTVNPGNNSTGTSGGSFVATRF